MASWRYLLIGGYVVTTFAGLLVATELGRPALGLGLIVTGTAMIVVHVVFTKAEERRESDSRQKWIDEVRHVADSVDLTDYGINDLADLARYHDEKGRQAVLTALRGLPPGARFLEAAARAVEPDAAWD